MAKLNTSLTLPELIEALATVGNLSIHRQPHGDFWVSFNPDRAGALWWYNCQPVLIEAVRVVYQKAIEYRFLVEVIEPAKVVLEGQAVLFGEST